MAENISLSKRWRTFQPTKVVLVWACIASAILTIALGFTWGGWMMAESVDYERTTAIAETRMELLASFCVDRFTAAEDAAVKLAELKKIGEWERRDVIRAGGWISVNNVTSPLDGAAATKCVERLMTVDLASLKAAK